MREVVGSSPTVPTIGLYYEDNGICPHNMVFLFYSIGKINFYDRHFSQENNQKKLISLFKIKIPRMSDRIRG